MTDAKPKTREERRRERLEHALRENLKRRKQQVRDRDSCAVLDQRDQEAAGETGDG